MIPWWELSSAGVILSSMERVGCKPFLATTNFSQWERRQMRTLLVRTTITKIISFPTIYCFFYDTDPAQAARLLRRHGTGMQKHVALQLNQRAPNAENIGENIARFNDLSNSPFTGAMTMENFWNQRLWIRKITQMLNCESPLSMGFAYAFYPRTELESRKHITYSLLVWGFAMYLGFWLLGLHWRFTSCVCVRLQADFLLK